MVVNVDAYESLADDHRVALDGSIDAAVDHYVANYGTLLEEWEDVFAEKGVTKVEIIDKELARFREGARPVRISWIEKMSARGLPARELYDLIPSTLAAMR